MQDGKFVVLCVDDDQGLLENLQLVIESGGYIVHTATSGAAGVQAFDDHNPDFVMIDMMMESISAGLEAARAIRSKNADVPMFMLTSVGHDMMELADPSSVQLTGFLQKPIDPDELLKLLKRELDEKA